MEPNKESVYYPALDGLRGIAILMVVTYHYFGFVEYFYLGWLGVDLFFVLSGYLITRSLLKSLNQPNYLRNFFMRRVLRIFPLYYSALILFIIIFPVVGLFKEDVSYYVEKQWWFWLYLQNWLFSFNFEGKGLFLNHFWSLAVEEQFYLVWPFLILWIKKAERLIVCMFLILILIIAARSLVWLFHDSTLNYTTLYTFTRIDGICLGCIVALTQKINKQFITKYRWQLVTGLAFINYVFFFLNRANKYDFPYYAFVGYSTFAAMFALLLHELVNGTFKWMNQLFSIQPLVFLGKISYGVYVYHWPVYILSFSYLKTKLESITTPSSASLLAALICFGITLLTSILSYFSFEKRFLQLKQAYH